MDYWTRGPAIGRGSSATVSLAASRAGSLFAVKSAPLSQSQFLQTEQQILSSINSPHVISYKGCSSTRENNQEFYNLFLEYMPGGTLSDAIIHQQQHQQQESMIGLYTRQILLGLEYLHSVGIVHCDIKGRNILIGNSGAKIADFGCARRVFSDNNEMRNSDHVRRRPTMAGTPVFMAPEVARGEEQGFSSDIWSLGCTIIEMVTGISGWPLRYNVAAAAEDDDGKSGSCSDPVTVLYQIAFSDQVPEIPGVLSLEAKDFLTKCLNRDPKQRWSATQLLQHPFILKNNMIASTTTKIDGDADDDGKVVEGEFNSSNIHIIKTTTVSPTSTLDQGIWNSVEEELSSHDSSSSFDDPILQKDDINGCLLVSRVSSTMITPSTCSDARRRISQLTMNCLIAVPPPPPPPRWDLDEDCWISVR